MIDLYDRVHLVIEEAWHLLPALKEQAYLTAIRLAHLGAVHGTYQPESGEIALNESLFAGTAHMLPLIDVNGESPPRSYPLCSRAIHTTLHELFHAILYATGTDDHPEWLTFSGWARAEDDPPGTQRYYERRPGWVQGPSEWRYRSGSYFVRPYSARSPYEQAADLCTHEALGWTGAITALQGRAQRAWLRRMVWDEHGARSLQASRERWRGQMQGVKDQWALTHPKIEKDKA